MRPQPLQQRRRLVLPRLDLEQRQRLAQRGEDEGQQVGRERRDQAEAEAARERVAQPARDGQHRVRLRHRPARVGEQAPAGVGGRHALGRPLEKRDPQLLLQLAELDGEGGLARPARLGGAAEMPVLGDGEEVAEVAQVH